MESNINYQGISEYSRAFSEKLTEKVFSKKDKINGEEILNITDIRQVNLFVMMNIFQKWKEEIKKIKSPYFDYASEEVQEAVDQLMNTLSRHISVAKDDFKPVLNKAVQQAILIIFSPYDFYRTEFFVKSRSIKDVKEEVKFVKINRFMLNDVMAQAEKRQIAELDLETGMRFLNEALENTQETPEDFDGYITQFSAVEPLNMDYLYSEKKTSPDKKSDFYTLNDQFLQEPQPTLVDIHRKVKIENIKGHITINQRFMFVNDLFNGKTEEFLAAVDELENKPTFQEALEFLKVNYGEKNGWDMESETLVEFLDVLSKRY